MKKLLTLGIAVLFTIGLVGCSAGDKIKDSKESTSTKEDTNENNKVNTNGKSLVVYFSVPETNNPNNMSSEEEYSTVVVDGEVLGNTQYVATIIQENTNSELFRIEPKTPYPMNHADLEEVATAEKRDNARPEIVSKIDYIEQYDTVFIGFPNWYGDMPMILYTFLEEYDFSGKTIIPFTTSGASGFSNNIDTIKNLLPKAMVIEDGLSILRNDVQDSESDIIDWVTNLGYKK